MLTAAAVSAIAAARNPGIMSQVRYLQLLAASHRLTDPVTAATWHTVCRPAL